ncbi:MAG: histidine--tRNA ligase [Treponema sp.]|nr:histidine--tRNA ligase [Treponema sp.]
MMPIIEPRILKGFRDFLPSQEIIRRRLMETVEGVFRSFGFVPIDTPALEYAEILLGKGGGETEKQIYRFRDNGDRDVALRFDLTVPFARFVALHQAEITLPFKRYHMAKVWRGENTQRGRYREFTQCDFDIVGSDSPGADFEILLMMREAMKALGVEVLIHLNHRGLFNRFLEHRGIGDKSVEILRSVDKLSKIGEEETGKRLEEIAGKEQAGAVLEYINAGGTFEEILDTLSGLAGGACPESERLSALRRFMIDTGTEASFQLDPSITRGLDYYTGIVYETFLKDDPAIGSVCSGGRYDNLAGLYMKDRISGVGSSIGLDRLIAALENLGKLEGLGSYAKLAVAGIREEDGGRCQALAGRFRARGIACEVLPEPSGSADPRQLTKQYILAEKKGARWLLIPAGGSENFTLRDLKKRENREDVSFEEALKITGN